MLQLPAIGSAPFCGALLADLGADVVRIDRVVGADLGSPKPAQFDFYNRNKRSVALDLKAPQAVHAVHCMPRTADILSEGFRPGAAERLGLGPEECLKTNVKLVYGCVTGSGQDGPLAQEVGHDINHLALSGALHCTGHEDQPPVPRPLSGGAADLCHLDWPFLPITFPSLARDRTEVRAVGAAGPPAHEDLLRPRRDHECAEREWRLIWRTGQLF